MKKLTFNKMRKAILFSRYTGMLALMLGSFSLNAQTTVQVGTATSTTDNAPVKTQVAFSYSQSLYMASDLIAGGATGVGMISKIRYYMNSGSNNANSNNLTVYLGNTNKVTFNTTTDWVAANMMTVCFSGVVTYTANSWVEITLTTPFLWNGTDNIVVGVDENASGTGGNAMWRYSDLGGANQRTIFYNNATNNPDPASPPTATSRGSWTPNIQFVWTSTPPCTGTPPHQTATVNDGSICPGQTVNFGMTSATAESGLSYEWEYNDGSGWQTYAGVTAATFSTTLAETVNVRALTTCISTGDIDTSEEVSVVVNPLPELTVNTPASAYCAGDNVQLIAADTSSATTFTWLPITGLNVANNDTVAASPVNPTTYTVTGTNSYGCTSTATASVTPLSMVTRSASYTPNQICAPGSPVSITASVTPALINGGSAWEYRFLDSDGVELQTWNSAATFNFIPAADSVYTIYYQVRSNGCADNVDSLPINVVVGFGADVDVVDYDCINLGGTVSLSEIFEPTETIIYANPFASTADLTGVTLQGNASVTGNRLVLTPSATGNIGSAIIQTPAITLGTNNSFIMKFDLTADQPINTFGTGGADGLTYSFADDLANNGNQNGSGSKLRLVFDAADNSSINFSGIYLVYGNTGGVSGTAVTPTAPSTVYYSNNTTSWKGKTDAKVVLTIDATGKASLKIDGVTIFSNVQMPAAYMSANTATWNHAFSAATGGDALRQAVSNWKIFNSSCQFALVPTTVTPSNWGDDMVFTGVQPGLYDVWMSNNGNASCAKMIRTIEVLNTNPLVQLGNDTTICEGESVTLDAGNAGATYVWSNSQVTTQTRTVTQEGLYVVNVTAANGCVGTGSINIEVMDAPTASIIYIENNMPAYTFTVLNPQNVDEYSWDFGDGSTLTNAPGTVSHTYLTAGPKQVSATLTNECGSETVIATVVVTSTASLETNEIEGLSIYPNPASDQLIISVPQTMNASAAIYSSTGSLIRTISKLDVQTELSVQNWESGVYFVRVQNDEKTSTIKLVIQ